MQVKNKTAGVLERWAIVIPWFLTLAVAAIGLWQFIGQERDANRRPFLEHQLLTCEEASKITSALAVATNPKEWDKQRQLFWQLYWGRIAIFDGFQGGGQDGPVREALQKGQEAKERLPMQSLRLPSLEVAHAARDMIARSWDVKLPAIRAASEVAADSKP
jgi:hypothetical protein